MVVTRGGNGRWLKKYKIFFLFGLIILIFQILLAVHFFEINTNSLQNDWQIQQKQQQHHISHNNNNNKKYQRKENTTTLVLNLDELNFKPECQINGKEAISAIHRAKTQYCKQLIANITCLSLNGQLYPKKLKSTCPSNGRLYGKSLGCFKDENNYRLLNGYFGINKKTNSPKYCIELCLQSGFPFAGVQYGNECFCGNDEPPSISKLPDSSCNMKCPGDSRATCGGYYTINVYQTGIRKFVPQTANTESSIIDEEPARIVFLLTLNGRALRQVKRLLKILYHRNHYYYIHIDVREDYLFRELLPLEKHFSNIRLTRRRFATIWGGASLLQMLLSCMSELLKMPNWRWDFILNLSESDYPVKTVKSLENFLTANKDRNFVKSHGRDTQRFLQKQGLDKTFVECEYRMWRISDRQLPNGIQIDGGSDWIALSNKFVNYLINQRDDLIDGLLKVFNYTLLPAESFFHTVLRNSIYCDSYIDNNLHVTNWKRKLGCKCQYKHVVDWCGCSPNDFRPDDWLRLQTTQTRQLYFARKFEPIINQAIIYKLELWLFGHERPPKKIKNIHSYWQNIYHHLDISPKIDDALKTITTSSIRVWCKTLKNCSVIPLKLFEITSYHSQDSYKSTLVHFQIDTGAIIDLEISFKPIKRITFLKSSTNFLVNHLEELSVSSDYDQKEQISRNFHRILSPYSDFVLIYRFTINYPLNLTCLWIDPTGLLVDINDIIIDENQLIGYTKPTLKQPHLPGVWTIKLISKQIELIDMKFLITPLEFFNDNIVTLKQARIINGGTIYSRNINNNNDYKQFLNNDNYISTLERIENPLKIGKDLQDWIDELFKQFYKIDSVCVNSEQLLDLCNIQLENCKKTVWSSFAPDPKSAIDKINETTGTFDIW